MRSGSVCPPLEAALLLQGQTDRFKAWHAMCQLNVLENDLS